jgi:2'-5' RNA ligase
VKQIEIYMCNLGYKSEEKPFLPHLTIGRVRDIVRREEVQNLEIKCSTFTRIDGITQITEIHLYKSELHRSDPVYTLIHSSPFQAPQ